MATATQNILLAQDRIADARGNAWLDKAKALREAGKTDDAERCHARGLYWLERSKKLHERQEPEPSLPSEAQHWSKAILGAFKKGAIAQRSGLPRSAALLYSNTRKPEDRVSMSRSFIAAWQDGWRWSEIGKAW